MQIKKKWVNQSLLWVALVLLAGLLLLSGCTGKDAPVTPGVVALVDGEQITLEDVGKEMEQREINWEMFQEMQRLLDEPFGNGQVEIPEERRADYDRFVRELGYDPAQLNEKQRYLIQNQFRIFTGMSGDLPPLSEEQRRYNRNAIYASPVFPLDENQIFNLLARRAVLYQEAVRQGHAVSPDEARRMQEQMDENSRRLGEEAGEIEQWARLMALQSEVVRRYGYRSRDDWSATLLPRQAADMSIRRLQQQFEEEFGAENPDVQGFDFQIQSANAWEDYTEHLLRQAVVKIKEKGFKPVFHGKEWTGDLPDLRTGRERREPEKTAQRTVFSIAEKWSDAEIDQIATILRGRMEHLGAVEIRVDVEEQHLLIRAAWEDAIPWTMLARRGEMRIGVGEEPEITNEHVERAEFVQRKQDNIPYLAVMLELNEEGAMIFAALTTGNVGRKVPIYLDGELLINPVVQAPITGGRTQISAADWSTAEMKALAAVLSSGPLPQELGHPAILSGLVQR